MTTAPPLDAEGLRDRVQKVLDDFLARQADLLDGVSEDLAPLMDSVMDLLRGGKRLRSAFCYWGWRGAGGPDDEHIVQVASALEMFHGAALLHDDVMDGSDTRRGMPAAHRRFAALHRGNGWLGSPDAFGLAAAILAGDLCLTWADEMFTASGLPADQLALGRPVFDRMRSELMAGQYLDILEQVLVTTSVERARRVIRFKTAQYTVVQPMRLGGALAGASPELLDGYTQFGGPLGEAFQLRDDILGVFGDPEETGKPAGDDLREGKRTVLVAATLARSSPKQAAHLRATLGDSRLDESGVSLLRETIVETGALEVVEEMIASLRDESLAALAHLPVEPNARVVLEGLVVAATERSG